MAWPTAPGYGTLAASSLIGEIITALSSWGGNADANGYILEDVGTVTADVVRAGDANGATANTALSVTDANILLYNFGSNNWAGLGADGSGNVWIRTGLSGTPIGALIVSPVGDLSILGSITQSSWAAVTLSGGWSNVGGGFPNLQYRRDKQGRVQVRGSITGGTATDGTVIATLPSGFRPATGTGTHLIPVSGNAGVGSILIGTSGAMSLLGLSSSSFLHLNAEFPTD
jgi:hypothetical protein